MTDTNNSLPTEFTEEENIVTLPILTPITEENTDTDDDCSSMPDLIPCEYDSCNFTPITKEDCFSSFGCGYKDVQQEPLIYYNDEEIEKREERYENWKENRRIRMLNPQEIISPLFKEQR
jgi:hypothetical protein